MGCWVYSGGAGVERLKEDDGSFVSKPLSSSYFILLYM